MAAASFIRRIDHSLSPSPRSRWFVFAQDRLAVVSRNGKMRLPTAEDFEAWGVQPENITLLGYSDELPCVLAELPAASHAADLQLIDLRTAFTTLSEHEYAIAGYASQIAHWDRTSRFCPVCATPTERVAHERAKKCPACGFTQYPRVSPAIIVLIHRPGQVLLSRQPQWPPNRYSLIAGFVEPGESLESSVRREIAEEVGVSVDELRYLGSQPWPFPHQLMIGFLARYHSGDLVVDRHELDDARWFDLDTLPGLPPPQSIARRILDWYLAEQPELLTPFPANLASL